MKLLNTILPLAAFTSALVIPDDEVMQQIAIEKPRSSSYWEDLKLSAHDIWNGVDSVGEDVLEESVAVGDSVIDNAIEMATRISKDTAGKFECLASMTAFDAQGWLNSAEETVDSFGLYDVFDPPPPPPPPRHGHHGHHSLESNLTVYQLIAGSKYTTKFTKLINEFPAVVELLNGTAANYTVFAPTDAAFEHIPDEKPSKEILGRVLAYHLSTEFYPAARVILSHTIPTSLREEQLGGESQRLRVRLGWGGLKVNFYSKIVAANIFGSNGVIHGVDSLLLPPPSTAKILSILPGQFSTFDYAVEKTGLGKTISRIPHVGGTLFAPTNWAFQKLGPKINAFLFSSNGEKYLKALLQYHIVLDHTLYSDAFYSAEKEKVKEDGIPRGRFHVDLPTLLEDKSLSIDVARWAGFITIKINGFDSVAVQDGIAKDGVIHAVSSLLIPPKTAGKDEEFNEEMTVEEFKDRFDGSMPEL